MTDALATISTDDMATLTIERFEALETPKDVTALAVCVAGVLAGLCAAFPCDPALLTVINLV